MRQCKFSPQIQAPIITSTVRGASRRQACAPATSQSQSQSQSQLLLNEEPQGRMLLLLYLVPFLLFLCDCPLHRISCVLVRLPALQQLDYNNYHCYHLPEPAHHLPGQLPSRPRTSPRLHSIILPSLPLLRPTPYPALLCALSVLPRLKLSPLVCARMTRFLPPAYSFSLFASD